MVYTLRATALRRARPSLGSAQAGGNLLAKVASSATSRNAREYSIVSAISSESSLESMQISVTDRR